MKSEKQEVLVPAEVQQILGIGRGTMYEMLAKGTIKGFRIGKTWRIPAAEVQRYIDNSLGEADTDTVKKPIINNPLLIPGFKKKK